MYIQYTVRIVRIVRKCIFIGLLWQKNLTKNLTVPDGQGAEVPG